MSRQESRPYIFRSKRGESRGFPLHGKQRGAAAIPDPSTRAFVGYSRSARTAGLGPPSILERRPDQVFSCDHGCSHHLWSEPVPTPCKRSAKSRATTGSRKLSVFPEPVPDVTTTFFNAASFLAKDILRDCA